MAARKPLVRFGGRTQELPAGDSLEIAATVRAEIEAMLVEGASVTFVLAGAGASRSLTINATGGGGGLADPNVLTRAFLRC